MSRRRNLLTAYREKVHCHFSSLAAEPSAMPFLNSPAYFNRSTICSDLQLTTGARSVAGPSRRLDRVNLCYLRELTAYGEVAVSYGHARARRHLSP